MECLVVGRGVHSTVCTDSLLRNVDVVPVGVVLMDLLIAAVIIGIADAGAAVALLLPKLSALEFNSCITIDSDKVVCVFVMKQ